MAKSPLDKKRYDLIDGVIPNEFSIGQGEDKTTLSSSKDELVIDNNLLVSGNVTIDDAISPDHAVTQRQLTEAENRLSSKMDEACDDLTEVIENTKTELNDKIDKLDEDVFNRINEVDNELTGDIERLKSDTNKKFNKVNEDIYNEITDRTNEDTFLSDKIDKESRRAQQAESDLGNQVSAEQMRATNAENRLSNSILQETGRAIVAENTLKNDLNAAVDALNKKIDDAHGGGPSLLDALNDEIEARITADDQIVEDLTNTREDLLERNDATNVRIDNEINDRIAADESLKTLLEMSRNNISAVDQKLADEINTRISADNALRASVPTSTSQLTNDGNGYSPYATEAEVAKKVNIRDVVDDLNSEYTDKPLSANQGRILNNKIDRHHVEVTTDEEMEALLIPNNEGLYVKFMGNNSEKGYETYRLYVIEPADVSDYIKPSEVVGDDQDTIDNYGTSDTLIPDASQGGKVFSKTYDVDGYSNHNAWGYNVSGDVGNNDHQKFMYTEGTAIAPHANEADKVNESFTPPFSNTGRGTNNGVAVQMSSGTNDGTCTQVLTNDFDVPPHVDHIKVTANIYVGTACGSSYNGIGIGDARKKRVPTHYCSAKLEIKVGNTILGSGNELKAELSEVFMDNLPNKNEGATGTSKDSSGRSFYYNCYTNNHFITKKDASKLTTLNIDLTQVGGRDINNKLTVSVVFTVVSHKGDAPLLGDQQITTAVLSNLDVEYTEGDFNLKFNRGDHADGNQINQVVHYSESENSLIDKCVFSCDNSYFKGWKSAPTVNGIEWIDNAEVSGTLTDKINATYNMYSVFDEIGFRFGDVTYNTYNNESLYLYPHWLVEGESYLVPTLNDPYYDVEVVYKDKNGVITTEFPTSIGEHTATINVTNKLSGRVDSRTITYVVSEVGYIANPVFVTESMMAEFVSNSVNESSQSINSRIDNEVQLLNESIEQANTRIDDTVTEFGTQLDSAVTDLESKINSGDSDNASKLTNLEERVNGIDNSVSSNTTNISNLTEKIDQEVIPSITSEVSRAKDAESTLGTRITNEIARAEAAEKDLNDNKLNNSGSETLSGDLTIHKDASNNASGDLTVEGDLVVKGITITEDVKTLSVQDNLIVTNSENAPLVGFSGLAINTGETNESFGIVYDNSTNRVKLGKGTITEGDFQFKEGEGLPIAIRDDAIENNHVVGFTTDKNKLVDTGIEYNTADGVAGLLLKYGYGDTVAMETDLLPSQINLKRIGSSESNYNELLLRENEIKLYNNYNDDYLDITRDKLRINNAPEGGDRHEFSVSSSELEFSVYSGTDVLMSSGLNAEGLTVSFDGTRTTYHDDHITKQNGDNTYSYGLPDKSGTFVMNGDLDEYLKRGYNRSETGGAGINIDWNLPPFIEIYNDNDAADISSDIFSIRTNEGNDAFNASIEAKSGFKVIKQNVVDSSNDTSTTYSNGIISKTVGTDNYIYNLPNESGTILIDSDLSEYLKQGSNEGTTEGSGIKVNKNSSPFLEVYNDTSGKKSDVSSDFISISASSGNDSFSAILDAQSGLTITKQNIVDASAEIRTNYANDSISRTIGADSYTYNLPNKSGTIALTDDVPKVKGTYKGEWDANTIYSKGDIVSVTIPINWSDNTEYYGSTDKNLTTVLFISNEDNNQNNNPNSDLELVPYALVSDTTTKHWNQCNAMESMHSILALSVLINHNPYGGTSSIDVKNRLIMEGNYFMHDFGQELQSHGDVYVDDQLHIYDSRGLVASSTDLQNYLPLEGGKLTGAIESSDGITLLSTSASEDAPAVLSATDAPSEVVVPKDKISYGKITRYDSQGNYYDVEFPNKAGTLATIEDVQTSNAGIYVLPIDSESYVLASDARAAVTAFNSGKVIICRMSGFMTAILLSLVEGETATAMYFTAYVGDDNVIKFTLILPNDAEGSSKLLFDQTSLIPDQKQLIIGDSGKSYDGSIEQKITAADLGVSGAIYTQMYNEQVQGGAFASDFNLPIENFSRTPVAGDYFMMIFYNEVNGMHTSMGIFKIVSVTETDALVHGISSQVITGAQGQQGTSVVGATLELVN